MRPCVTLELGTSDDPETVHRSPITITLHLPDEHRAQVTLGIQHPSGPVYLKGIVVREMRPGWLNVQVPPMESWTDPMRRLTHDQRERLETPEFYELLQREISRRLTPELFQSG